MSNAMPEALTRLMQEFQRLPGIGPRSAERLAFHILRSDRESALGLARAISDVKTQVRHCRICFNLTQADPCPICSDVRRDRGQIVVVEQPNDLLQLESTGLIRGVYHVLLGHIAPLDGVEPGDLTIEALIDRVKAGGVNEVVLATNPNLEGDGTNLHLRSVLAPLGVRVSQLARGLPSGSQLEYASPAILRDAFEGRRDV